MGITVKKQRQRHYQPSQRTRNSHIKKLFPGKNALFDLNERSHGTNAAGNKKIHGNVIGQRRTDLVKPGGKIMPEFMHRKNAQKRQRERKPQFPVFGGKRSGRNKTLLAEKEKLAFRPFAAR